MGLHHCAFKSKYSLLGKNTTYMLLLKFLFLDLRGRLKTASWISQWADSLQASLQVLQATAALSSSGIFLTSWYAAKSLMLQSYKPTDLIPHFTITCASPLLCIKWRNCAVIENWNEAWKASHLQCGGSRTLINDTAQIVYRVRQGLLYDSSFWRPFITEDMMPDDALLQQ